MVKRIEQGTVINIKKNKAEILFKPSSMCMTCQKCERGKEGKFHLMVEDSLGCKKGEKVEVQIVTPSQLKAIILLYGLPLIVFILVNIIVYSILDNLKFNPDLSVIIGLSSAILFTGITYYIISKWCKRKVKAEVVRIL